MVTSGRFERAGESEKKEKEEEYASAIQRQETN